MSEDHKRPTQAGKILKVLEEADGEWVNARVFIQQMFLSQTSARITELRHKGYAIETSDFRDSYRFVSYRLKLGEGQQALF